MASKKKVSDGGVKKGTRKRKQSGPSSVGADGTAGAATPQASSSTTSSSFDREKIYATIIAVPLFDKLKETEAALNAGDGVPAALDVIIEVNLNFPGGRDLARQAICEQIRRLERTVTSGGDVDATVKMSKSDGTHYVFARLHHELIRKLAVENDPQKTQSGRRIENPVHKIWPDFEVSAFICRTVSTVKANAVQTAFGACGQDIVWAVVDSGVEKHQHFTRHENLESKGKPYHRDFTLDEVTTDDVTADDPGALVDVYGHGSHVAGIIAGEYDAVGEAKIVTKTMKKTGMGGNAEVEEQAILRMAGMAPRCRLVSLKVLNDEGKGAVTNIIAALQYVQRMNDYGRMIRIHGVNLSLGYPFDAAWFACGQSPLCVEVNRLVQSGVVVVVAAGNTGYGTNQTTFRGPGQAGLDISINDPGNAQEAITVGSTHRDMPHRYGVSYFSSKGPTGDGRMKPDLLAPGERILSCASKAHGAAEGPGPAVYREETGTSMAAPHVSGVIAAFLSVRNEFIGRPQRMKEILCSTATDLGRAPYFQGSGLVDAMRAIQAV